MNLLHKELSPVADLYVCINNSIHIIRSRIFLLLAFHYRRWSPLAGIGSWLFGEPFGLLNQIPINFYLSDNNLKFTKDSEETANKLRLLPTLLRFSSGDLLLHERLDDFSFHCFTSTPLLGYCYSAANPESLQFLSNVLNQFTTSAFAIVELCFLSRFEHWPWSIHSEL